MIEWFSKKNGLREFFVHTLTEPRQMGLSYHRQTVSCKNIYITSQ